jgi:acetyl-CoA synthetase
MSDAIVSHLREDRQFLPSDAFRTHARVSSKESYERAYRESLVDPAAFWREAMSDLVWRKPWSTFQEGDAGAATFFSDGTLNVSESCLDRHLDSPRKHKAAIVWEGEPGELRVMTYAELHREVLRLSAALIDLGVKAGDRVAIYMGMVPEAAAAMLACARIGAVHSVVFGGFSAEALRDRINDSGAKVLLTQDGAWRRGSVVPLKAMADKALENCPGLTHVLCVKRIASQEKCPVSMKEGRDHDWHSFLDAPRSPEARALAEHPPAFPAEHPLFILYTSGSTGKPKGLVHSSGGYLAGAHVTAKYVFDMKETDLYWCTADVGWVTGHSYIVYGPLSVGASCFMYEGAPNAPDPSRFWRMIERHGITILYTAPTAIRAFIRWGDEHVTKHDLSSLRLLGSVGEPINPEAWMWYRRVIGGDRCPIVDTWWQTETGSILITTLPGAVAAKPGSAGLPMFGVVPSVVKDSGAACAANEGGRLLIDRPWPSMARTIWGDHERYLATYWEAVPGKYVTGDGARIDHDGYTWVVGRIDDVLNVAGHRIGTAEIESALVGHSAVAEAAAVGRPDELKGQALVVFVTLKSGQVAGPAMKASLTEHIDKEIGKFARPDVIRFADALPKTRSGKIMRRLLRDVASGTESKGDTSTLEDLAVLATLRGGKDDE